MKKTVTTTNRLFRREGRRSRQEPARLQFCRVSTDLGDDYDVPVWEVDFSLKAGELLLIRLEEGCKVTPIADLALGLLHPRQGQVCFNGDSWQSLTAERAARLRGRCRRVFAEQGWYTAQTLITNICLARQHHRQGSDAELEAEAAALARFFGLPGLPLGRPEATRADDLRRAELVRAFLGRPQLLILEEPTRELFPEILQALINAVNRALARGAAVIWTTSDPRVWDCPHIAASLRGAMYGSRMQLQV